jgi:ABC-2 type transport system ATP-binding protein
MLTGLIHPSGGEVNVAGYRPFERNPEFLRRITLVMGQKEQLLWDLPALDSLRINAALYELSPKDAGRRIDELAELLSLQDKLKQPIRKLSLGERMKTELLAALLHDPQVLFLDEPTLGLDINAQAAVRAALLEYNRRRGATILLTSHYMADITALSSRVLVIHEGTLIYDGALQGLLDRFAPYREVKVQLEREVSREVLAEYGEVAALEGLEARLLVERAQLTACVSRLLANLPVLDLGVADPPVEEVIGRVFAQGAS